MKILLTNNHLYRPGGSETACYTLAMELLRKGHEVHIYTPNQGGVYARMIKGGCKAIAPGRYDLAICSHTPTQTHVMKNPHITIGKLIRVCHGVPMELEHPHPGADKYVSISEEVQIFLEVRKYASDIILNGIDCERFKPTNPLRPKLKKVLALTQSDKARNLLGQACEALGVGLLTLDKFKNPRWDVEYAINEADMVVSLGRGALESMACGRPVLVWDWRDYNGNKGDGIINQNRIEGISSRNFSGRYTGNSYSVEMLMHALRLYKPELGQWGREWVLENANIEKQADKYLRL